MITNKTTRILVTEDESVMTVEIKKTADFDMKLYHGKTSRLQMAYRIMNGIGASIKTACETIVEMETIGGEDFFTDEITPRKKLLAEIGKLLSIHYSEANGYVALFPKTWEDEVALHGLFGLDMVVVETTLDDSLISVIMPATCPLTSQINEEETMCVHSGRNTYLQVALM